MQVVAGCYDILANQTRIEHLLSGEITFLAGKWYFVYPERSEGMGYATDGRSNMKIQDLFKFHAYVDCAGHVYFLDVQTQHKTYMDAAQRQRKALDGWISGW